MLKARKKTLYDKINSPEEYYREPKIVPVAVLKKPKVGKKKNKKNGK